MLHQPAGWHSACVYTDTEKLQQDSTCVRSNKNPTDNCKKLNNFNLRTIIPIFLGKNIFEVLPKNIGWWSSSCTFKYVQIKQLM